MKRFKYYFTIAIIIAIAQIFILLSMIKSQDDLLKNGREIALKIQPIDPRDFMRGDYVILSYEFMDSVRKIRERQRDIYVLLRQDENQDWVYVMYQNEPFSNLLANEVQLHGRKEGYSYQFGIDRFYVPDGQGKEIENKMRQDNNKGYSVIISVMPSGTAAVKSLRYHDEDLF